MLAKTIIILVLVAVSVGTTWAQEDVPSISVSDLPPELAGKVDEQTVRRIQNQTLATFKEKCEKNGGPNAFNQAQNATMKLGQCVAGLINSEQVSKEIEEAKPQGTVDEVFKKYCAKKPLFEECIKNNTEDAQVCFSLDEQKKLKTVVFNVTEQLAEFICFKEGDRIALFIAEGGQECISENRDGLMGCFNSTTGADSSNLTESFDPSSLSSFNLSFDEEQCKKFFDLQECVVSVLEKCAKPTSANIVESLFKFVRKSTPCKNFKVTPATRSDKFNPKTKSRASGVFVATTTVMMAAFAFIFV